MKEHYIKGSELSNELKLNINTDYDLLLNWLCIQFCYDVLELDKTLSVEQQNQLKQFIKHLL